MLSSPFSCIFLYPVASPTPLVLLEEIHEAFPHRIFKYVFYDLIQALRNPHSMIIEAALPDRALKSQPVQFKGCFSLDGLDISRDGVCVFRLGKNMEVIRHQAICEEQHVVFGGEVNNSLNRSSRIFAICENEFSLMSARRQ